MTQITADHAEWAVVGRLGLMLAEPPHPTFNVTQAYSLCVTILCWVMQRVRIPEHKVQSESDRAARGLYEELHGIKAAAAPWAFPVNSVERIAMLGRHRVTVPASSNLEDHSVARILKNLRDATAHGDARNVKAFNVSTDAGQILAGFRFSCAELNGGWTGEITLVESDLRQIGTRLARVYCDTVRRSGTHRHDGYFGRDAANIRETLGI